MIDKYRTITPFKRSGETTKNFGLAENAAFIRVRSLRITNRTLENKLACLNREAKERTNEPHLEDSGTVAGAGNLPG